MKEGEEVLKCGSSKMLEGGKIEAGGLRTEDGGELITTNIKGETGQLRACETFETCERLKWTRG